MSDEVHTMACAVHVPLATSTGADSRGAVAMQVTAGDLAATRWNVDRPA